MTKEPHDKNKAPRIFISYSHDDPEHCRRIFELCEQLRKKGLDCRIDQHEVFPSQGWDAWTRDRIRYADCILVACTGNYLKLFSGLRDSESWHGAILSPADVERDISRFVPVLPQRELNVIPEPLQSRSHFHISDNQGRELLVRYLTEKCGLDTSRGTMSLPPLPPRQDFSTPLPLKKPIFLPRLLSPMFTGREKQLKSLLAANKGRLSILRSAPGIGASQLILKYIEEHQDDHTALLWFEHGTTPLLRRQLDNCLQTLEAAPKDREAASMAGQMNRWLREHSQWLLVLDSWPDDSLLTRVLLEGELEGTVLWIRPPGFEEDSSTHVLVLAPPTEREILAFFRRRTGRRSMKKEEREACLELVDLFPKSFINLNLAASWVAEQRNSRASSFQSLLQRLKARMKDSPESEATGFHELLNLCLERAAALDHLLRPLLTLAVALDDPRMCGSLPMRALDAREDTLRLARNSGFLVHTPDAHELVVHPALLPEFRSIFTTEQRTAALEHFKPFLYIAPNTLEVLDEYALEMLSDSCRRHGLILPYSERSSVPPPFLPAVECAAKTEQEERSQDTVPPARAPAPLATEPRVRVSPPPAVHIEERDHQDKEEAELNPEANENKSAAQISFTRHSPLMLQHLSRAFTLLAEARETRGKDIAVKSTEGPVVEPIVEPAVEPAPVSGTEAAAAHKRRKPQPAKVLDIGSVGHPDADKDTSLKQMYKSLGQAHALKDECKEGGGHVGLLAALIAFILGILGLDKNSGDSHTKESAAADATATEPRAEAVSPPTESRNADFSISVTKAAEGSDNGKDAAPEAVKRERPPSVRAPGEEPDLPGTAAECEKRAEECRLQGDGEAAERFLARALQLLEKLHGPVHRDVARACNSLGELYKQMGMLDRAEIMHERGLSIRETIWEGEHKEVAQSCTNLGSVFRQLGRLREAEALYLRALAIDEALLGSDDADTATDCNNLAVLYFGMERYAEALRSIRRAISIREKALGDAHPYLAQAFENCGAILRKLGRYREADEMMSKGGEVRSRHQSRMTERKANQA